MIDRIQEQYERLFDNRGVEFWEEGGERRHPTHPAVKAFVEPKLEYVFNYVVFQTDSPQVLDVGCGNGYFTYYLQKNYSAVGIDYSVNMLAQNPTESLVRASAHQLPFPADSFEMVFCSNLLHHVHDPDRILAEMKRVSERYVVISEPNRNNPLMFLFSALIPEERGALKFTLPYIERLADSAGLEIVSSTNTGAVVPNKTPKWCVPLFEKFEWTLPIMFYNVVVTELP